MQMLQFAVPKGDRRSIGDLIDQLIAMLDAADPDSDLEPAGDEEDHAWREGHSLRDSQSPFEDDEDDGTAEPSLAFPERCQFGNLAGFADDREHNADDAAQEDAGDQNEVDDFRQSEAA